jgi:hypothetical protein
MREGRCMLTTTPVRAFVGFENGCCAMDRVAYGGDDPETLCWLTQSPAIPRG